MSYNVDPLYTTPPATITVAEHQQVVAKLEQKCEALQVEVEHILDLLQTTRRHIDTLCQNLKAVV